MSMPRLKMLAVLFGVVGGISYVTGVAMHVDREIVFRSYLFAYLFCLGISLGSLSLLLLHNLTGGDWGNEIRPHIRAAARTIPLMALLFVPICLGLSALYPWARPEEVAGDHILAHRAPYLNVPFFLTRAAIYFVAWIALGLAAARENPMTRGLSAAGLIIYLLTMTHAGIDWVMSREVGFYSTAFGFVITVGQNLSALALAVLLHPGRPAPKLAPSNAPPSRAVFNDIGNVLLTLVILWAYVSFMEFLVIWMGNSREDNVWYLQRGLSGNSQGSDAFAWRTVGIAIVVFHFFVPFYLLLFRKTKQSSRALPIVAGVLLAAHALEQYWLIAPAGHGELPRFNLHWMDVAALVGLLGIWFTLFLTLLSRAPLEAKLALPAEGRVTHD